MTRLIFALIVLLIVATLFVWGDRIAGRLLDRELGPLLTRELGLPVKLAPIQARLWQLKARSPKLVMGDPNDPAVVAHGVEVTLPLQALFRGEVRLRTASAADLMVRPARWPSSGDPLPDNYRFLEPWLPKKLHLEQGAYVTDTGSRYPVKQASWARKSDGGAGVEWLEERSRVVLEVSAGLKSLADLLDLAPVALELTVQAQGEPDSAVSLQSTIKPDDGQGYLLDVTAVHGGTQAHIVTGNSKAWQLPEQSTTTVDQLDLEELHKSLGYYTNKGSETAASSALASPLPRLSLIDHKGKVSIDEILLDDEKGADTVVHFQANAQGLEISSLRSHGPEATATGSIGIFSGDDGWQLSVLLNAAPRELDSGSIAGQYLGADWLWRSGHTELTGAGNSWGSLLHSLQGSIRLEGHHRGKSDTPIKLKAQLDNNPEKLLLDQLDINIGQGHITGSLSLAGDKQRVITGDIRTELLDLHFLFDETDLEPAPGVAVPTYLAMFPRLNLDLKAAINGFNFPGISLTKADISLRRTQESATLLATITGPSGGSLGVDLTGNRKSGDLTLDMQLERLDIPGMFEQKTLLYSRSTGTLSLHSKGAELAEIFEAMTGDASLSVEFRSDNNWKRPALLDETLQFSGKSSLVIKDHRILGVAFSALDVESTQQDITGSLSVVSQRTPWLIANLQSERLDVQGLLDLLPESPQSADQADMLTAFRDVGPLSLTMDARSVNASRFLQRDARQRPLEDVHLKLVSGPNLMKIERLDFTLEGSPIASKGALEWQGKRASFNASVQTSNFNLDRFLLQNPDIPPVPVSGTASIKSEGATFAELLANASGDVDLSADQKAAPGDLKKRREVQMTIRRIDNGMHAEISQLLLGTSDLTGSVRYLMTSPAQLELKINSGSFSLVPWEAGQQDPQVAAADEKGKEGETSIIGSAAETSARFVGRALSAPSRFLLGPAEAPAGEKYFSSEALPFEKLHNVHATIEGQMNALTGLDHIVQDLSIKGTVKNGQLALQVKAGNLNGGTANADLAIDSLATPARVRLDTHFEKVGGIPGRDGYPKTGVLMLHSQGNSAAQLAANLNGQAFLELGEGPFNYANVAFLSADVATRATQALMPGTEKNKPRLECAMTMATFKDGKGITPHGYAARTQQANLIGRIEVDLKTELMQLQFDSRSREGVGLAVGNVFSNTIQIKGPLTDPEIVPNTTGLAWRGWAAFMTGGLSVVGESVLKRALAAENPCKAIRKDIRESVCGTDQPLASAKVVCPGA